jgi:hypothetical protein
MKTFSRVRLLAAVTLALTLGISLSEGQSSEAATKKKASSKASVKMGGAKKVNVKAGEITGTAKMCSGVNPPSWRDTILTPDTWQIGACQSWASSIGALHYQLGCATPTGFVWSPMDSSANPGCWP